MQTLVRILARFVTASDGSPIGGPNYAVQLYDQDAIADDLLAEAPLPADGNIGLTFDLMAASSTDSPLETEPDLYLVLVRDGKEVFRSTVAKNVAFLGNHPVTGMDLGRTQDLGVFKVP